MLAPDFGPHGVYFVEAQNTKVRESWECPSIFQKRTLETGQMFPQGQNTRKEYLIG